MPPVLHQVQEGPVGQPAPSRPRGTEHHHCGLTGVQEPRARIPVSAGNKTLLLPCIKLYLVTSNEKIRYLNYSQICHFAIKMSVLLPVDTFNLFYFLRFTLPDENSNFMSLLCDSLRQ